MITIDRNPQQRFAASAVQGWMEHNAARMMQITMRVAQESFRPFVNRSVSSDDQRRDR